MAWLPSSCHAVHRRLRIPDLRKGRDSPLSTRPPPCHQTASPSRRLSTPRIPRSDLNARCQTRSLLSVSSSPVPSLAACSDVLAASVKHGIWFYDTVRLGDRGIGQTTTHPGSSPSALLSIGASLHQTCHPTRPQTPNQQNPVDHTDPGFISARSRRFRP